MNTLEELNTDLESMTMSHGTQDNGGSLTEELEPLDQVKRETSLSQIKEVKDTSLTELLLLDNMQESHPKCSLSMVVHTETSETYQETVLMFTETQIQTTDMLSPILATMELIKVGPLTDKESITQDILLLME